jgi:hypothetical protein
MLETESFQMCNVIPAKTKIIITGFACKEQFHLFLGSVHHHCQLKDGLWLNREKETGGSGLRFR